MGPATSFLKRLKSIEPHIALTKNSINTSLGQVHTLIIDKASEN